MFERIVDNTPILVQAAANILIDQARQNGGAVRYRQDAGMQGRDDWALYYQAARWLEQQSKGRMVAGGDGFRYFDFRLTLSWG